MNDTKKYILVCFICLVLIFTCCWFVQSLFNNGRTDGRIRDSLDRLADEQRNAAESVERIERGLDDSTARVADIDRRIAEHAESLERITGSVERGQEGIRASKKIARDSEQRITDCLRICSEIRKTEKQD